MKPSLTAARRALLELQAMPIHKDSEIGVRLSIISEYLEAQVALNVESLAAAINYSSVAAIQSEAAARRADAWEGRTYADDGDGRGVGLAQLDRDAERADMFGDPNVRTYGIAPISSAGGSSGAGAGGRPFCGLCLGKGHRVAGCNHA